MVGDFMEIEPPRHGVAKTPEKPKEKNKETVATIQSFLVLTVGI
jgi:hypothetical protein